MLHSVLTHTHPHTVIYVSVHLWASAQCFHVKSSTLSLTHLNRSEISFMCVWLVRLHLLFNLITSKRTESQTHCIMDDWQLLLCHQIFSSPAKTTEDSALWLAETGCLHKYVHLTQVNETLKFMGCLTAGNHSNRKDTQGSRKLNNVNGSCSVQPLYLIWTFLLIDRCLVKSASLLRHLNRAWSC